MKIIVDIPEDDYYGILQYAELKVNTEFENLMIVAIKNGIPLPKGHGDLIDLEEVRDRYVNIIKVSNSELENLRMLAEILDTSPTIIKADIAESEAQNDKEDM